MRTPSLLTTAALSLASLLCVTAGHAATINFDEFPPSNGAALLGEQYADMGIHFIPGDDGSVWAGIGGGDPGKWGMEGTNGTAFVGFNGPSYLLGALFDALVDDVAIDVSSAKGSSMGDTFTLVGFVEGAIVDEVTVTLEGPNVWQTVALTQSVDEIQLFGSGASFHPFGVDNLVWVEAGAVVDPPVEDEEEEELPEETLTVEMDLEPWSRWSSWWMRSWTPVFVVVYGSESLDVESVDPDSLELGPDAATASHHVFYWDLNRDGHADMISRFRAIETGITASDDEACVTGMTFDGVSIEGCDVREVNTRKRDRRRDRRRRDH
jgi:hypothetical protein